MALIHSFFFWGGGGGLKCKNLLFEESFYEIKLVKNVLAGLNKKQTLEFFIKVDFCAFFKISDFFNSSVARAQIVA